jgi:hypothetical protein
MRCFSAPIIPVTLFVFLVGLRLSAQTITALQWNSTGTIRSDGAYTVGNSFIVSALSDLQVTGLGVMDVASDGFLGTVQVGLWDSTGTNLLASITSGFSAGNPTVGNYRFQTLGAPVTLTANTTYLIGALIGGPGNGNFETFIDNSGAAAITTTSAAATYLTLGNSTFNVGAALAAPTTSGGTPIGRWGPANLQFAAVPEPSTYAALAGLGALGFAVLRRRRQAAA